MEVLVALAAELEVLVALAAELEVLVADLAADQAGRVVLALPVRLAAHCLKAVS